MQIGIRLHDTLPMALPERLAHTREQGFSCAHVALSKVIDDFDGVLPFNDRANPDVVMRALHMSKNAFKRAVGRLLKEGRIRITEPTIERI